MKSSENLRLIVRAKRVYRKACDSALRLSFGAKQTTSPTNAANAKNPNDNAAKKTSNMPDSDTLGGLAGLLGLIAAGLVVAAWLIARRENREKADAAREQSLLIARLNATAESLKSDAETSRLAIATANQRAAEADLKTTQLRRTLGDRFITNEEAEAFVAAAKNLPKPALIRVVPESFQDGDADAYSRQIQAMLEKAGYKCERILPGEWDTVTGSFSLYTDQRFPVPQSNRLEAINHGAWSYQLYDLFRATLGVYIMPGSARYPAITPADGGIIVIGHKPDVKLPPP